MLDKLQGYVANRCFQNAGEREKEKKRVKKGKKNRERGRAQERATGQKNI